MCQIIPYCVINNSTSIEIGYDLQCASRYTCQVDIVVEVPWILVGFLGFLMDSLDSWWIPWILGGFLGFFADSCWIPRILVFLLLI